MLGPIFGLLFSLSMGSLAFAAEPPAPYPMASEARVQEVKDLTFGMWTCWSLSTFTNQEYTRGVKDPNFFNVTGCDPDQWVATAKAAGMKYIILTTKHHDGFCLWDTKQTDYNIMGSPFGRDVVKELAAARGGGDPPPHFLTEMNGPAGHDSVQQPLCWTLGPGDPES